MNRHASWAINISVVVVGACSDDEGGRRGAEGQIPCSSDGVCVAAFPEATSCEEPTCREGFCALDQLPDGTFCSDGKVCTGPDSCRAGVCGGVPVACDDGNACTEDYCDSKQGCVFDAVAATCDDGDPCTVGDVCSNKQCLSGALADGCCVHDAECGDGDVCTDDRCIDHRCEQIHNEAPCSDDNPCTRMDRCREGACAGEPLTCDDGFACTVDACEPATGLCASTPASDGTACDDRNACTEVDTCIDAFCVGAGDLCDCTTDADCVAFEDDDVCNGTLVCEQHACVLDPSTVIACAESGAACAPSACDPATGQCVPSAAADGTRCDDQNACTVGDACARGLCVGAPDACDDGNECTFDQCLPDQGCVHVEHALPCDDGVACTFGDVCGGGACAGRAVDCDDDNPCTDDACAGGQCVHTPNTASCDDGSACTSGERCAGGACGGGTSLCECVDDADCAGDEDGDRCNGTLECVGNRCQVDPSTVVTCNTAGDTACRRTQCHSATGQCVAVDAPGGTACNDGSACTGPDVCTAGVCGGAAVDCNDQNPCTTDACSAATGCTHVNNTAACIDGNACTSGDVCAGGSCQGAALACDDGNACTIDSCNAASGCVHTPVGNGTSCADADLCDGEETCQAGVCSPGPALGCDDLNVCTNDSCNPALGCVHVNVMNGTPCLDANVCDGAESCQSGVCAAGAALLCNDNNPCTTDECDAVSGCFYTPRSCNAPAISCGADVETVPLQTVTVSGSASDPDGGTVSFRWTVTSAPTGSTAAPVNPTGATTGFTPDLAGVYELTLTATDDEGETSSCTVLVTALALEALRIELVWDTAYGDADLHLIRPGANPASSWYMHTQIGEDDCWFENTTAAWPPNGAAGNASLDADDANGYGPENINIDTSPAAGDYTIGVAYYCSHSVGARGGKPEPLTPGDGPAGATVRIYCSGVLVREVAGIDLDKTGRFVEVGTVNWPTCAVTVRNTRTWTPLVQPTYYSLPIHCAVSCSRDSDCPGGDVCSSGSCVLD